MMPWRHAILVCVAALGGLASTASAQQFVTDDADVVERGACQIEAWYAPAAAWLLPACHLAPHLEVTVGFGAVEGADGRYAARYVLQGKTFLRRFAAGRGGLALVAGVGLDPLGQAAPRQVDAVFAYVPVSTSWAEEVVTLHANAGWAYGEAPVDESAAAGGRKHAATWGLRGDVRLARRLTLIGELFGESGATPEYQVGARIALRPERLVMDVSHLRAAARDDRGTVVVGVAWTPAPWRRGASGEKKE